jgi:hypothetical protein
MRLIDADKLPEHKFTRESAKGNDYMRGWNDAIDAIVDNEPTVLHDNYSEGYQDGVRKVLSERPQGERAERALAIIDRLRTDGHINNKEQGALRRAILLPERPQGKWIGIAGAYRCDKCYGKLWYRSDYCPQCGVRMIKEAENETN